MPTISRPTGERFGNMPLPIEMSSRAAEGELMVSKTTGHMYIRNGGKNVSKTVELEEFLKALRLGCMNWIRNSGDFYEELARLDWWYIDQHLEGTNNYSFETDEITGRKYLKLRTSGDSGWKYLFNKIGTYYKIKFLPNNKICVSIKCKSSVNTRISVSLCNGEQTQFITDVQTLDITTEWKKYEFMLTANGDTLTEGIGLYIGLSTTNMDFCLEYAQMEPGDRSSEWRPSWLDYYQRLDYMNNGLKEWVKEQIREAVEQCKEYTDSEITKLDTKLQNTITEAIKTCKDYTNSEITKVNERIDNEVDELIRRDMMQRVHLNLGNQDYTKYLKLTTGDGTIDPSRVYYSNDNKGIIIKGKVSLQLDLPIPITEFSKYYLYIKFIRLKGNSIAYAGVDSLDGNLNTLSTDTATTFNYGLLAGEKIYSEGEVVTAKAIYNGFNTTTEGTKNKFDPFAQYFKFIFMPNYSAISNEDSVVIKDIEIFEIPKCLWNALDAGPRDRDGLMSVADKTKLDGIEERANRYIHPTGDGNLHVPATGDKNAGKVLTAGSTPGSLQWVLPSTDAETIDGFDSNKFLRDVPCPSHRDCNQFLTVNAFFYADTGAGQLLNTPEGTLAYGSARVVMVINRYSAYCNGDIRLQQEFINLYSVNKTTRYIRNYNGNMWGPWAKVYTTGDKPTTQEINAVNKSGDNMTGDLTMSNDNLGINFFNGAKIYKKQGKGLVIRNDNEVNPVSIETYSGISIMNMTKELVTASGKFKSKNIDTGRFSLIYDQNETCLDFIFE